MPLTHIYLKKGKSIEYRRALMEQVHLATVDAYGAPENGRFMTVSEHDDGGFDFGPDYLDIQRSVDFVIIEIIANNTRSIDAKKALYAKISERLALDPGVRPEDVFITLIDVPTENWSFGNGEAQYA